MILNSPQAGKEQRLMTNGWRRREKEQQKKEQGKRKVRYYSLIDNTFCTILSENTDIGVAKSKNMACDLSAKVLTDNRRRCLI